MPSLHLIFARHGVHYALEAAMVQEIAWLPELSAVADASSWVIGAFNNHGRVVAVLDLALCFGRGRSASRVSDAVVVVGIGGERFAIVADDLVDAAPIVPADVEALDERRALLGCAAPLVSGIAMCGEQLAMVLDVRALLAGAGAAAAGEDEAEGASPEAAPAASDREVFRARARLLAQPLEAAGGAEGEQFTLVSLDAEVIGVPVRVVREFMRLGSVWPVPCCPPHILGIMNVRGDILTVVDLRPVLGLLAQRPPSEVMVIRRGELTLGLAVSEILDIVEVDGVLPPPPTAAEGEMPFRYGTARAGERVFAVIDIESLLASRAFHVADARGRGQALPEDRVFSAGG
jgi:purine-binding chemotaxis protein CheW